MTEIHRQETTVPTIQPATSDTHSRGTVDLPCFQCEAKGSCSFGPTCKYQHRKKAEKAVVPPSELAGAVKAEPIHLPASAPVPPPQAVAIPEPVQVHF